MNYCARCLYPQNHPLNLTFDEQGVCSGCRVHEEKDQWDWQARGKMLGALFERFRRTSSHGYDCIIPVSGARDSYFIVHTVKNVYGLNPLLVSYNKHYNTHRGIRNLTRLREVFDCDLLERILAPQRLKAMTRRALEKRGNMYWHCLAGNSVYPVQTAVQFNIPLIVWGAHQGCDQVGMFSHGDEVEMTRKYRKDHDLLGLEAEDLLDETAGVTENVVEPFKYPHEKAIEKVGVRGIYLGNYIRWDSKKQHEEMIDRYGYETSRQQRTFDTYNDVDCVHYSGLHDYIKFLKWGYGKVTDHACREIRLRRMTREEGIELVRRYEEVVPSDLPLFLKWIGMTESEFFAHIDRHRDTRAWRREDGIWTLIDSVTRHSGDAGVDRVRLEKLESCEFLVTPANDRYPENRYYLLAKGHAEYEP